MRVRSALALHLAAAGLALVACGRSTPTRASEGDLVGGTIAPPAVASSLLRFAGCTASRVGERELLLAAHCVVDNRTAQIRPDQGPGSLVETLAAVDFHGEVIDAALDGGMDRLRSILRHLEVEAVFVHPSYLEELQATPIGPHLFEPRQVRLAKSADVAVVRLKTPLEPAISVARVWSHVPAAGDGVTLVGAGCMIGPDVAETAFGFKAAASRVIDSAEVQRLVAVNDAGTSEIDDPSCTPDNCFFVPGLATGELANVSSAGEICPGDSGGPVLVQRGGDLAIVAVNRLARSYASGDLRALYDAVTRLDDGSEQKVAGWLRELGVPVDP